MTAHRSSAGSARTMVRRSRAPSNRRCWRFSGERVTLQGAGRTDSGVHALGQVAHFDLASEKPAETVRSALNFHLKPDPIAITEVEIVPAAFNARFSATGRRYRYLILNRRAPPAIDRGRVWHVPVPLDSDAMADAASVLRGHHDFNSFRSTACQAPSSIKTLDLFDVHAQRRRDPHRCRQPLVPAQPGAHPGRHAGAGRPRPMEPARRRGSAGRARPHARRADRAAARSLPDGGALRPSRRRQGRCRGSERRGMKERRDGTQLTISRTAGDRPADAERHPRRHQEPVEDQRLQAEIDDDRRQRAASPHETAIR